MGKENAGLRTEPWFSLKPSDHFGSDNGFAYTCWAAYERASNARKFPQSGFGGVNLVASQFH
jgi:hypothetical protein